MVRRKMVVHFGALLFIFFTCVQISVSTEATLTVRTSAGPGCYTPKPPQNGAVSCDYYSQELGDVLCKITCKPGFAFDGVKPQSLSFVCYNDSRTFTHDPITPACIEDVSKSQAPENAAAQASCVTWGMDHYKTFDNNMYSFSGQCTYMLAFQPHAFDIMVVNSCEEDGTQCKRGIDVLFRDVKIQLRGSTQGPKVLYNGESFQVPGSRAGIIFEQIGDYLTVRSTLGFTIRWDGKHYIYVQVSENLKNKMAGLCGNYNGDLSDDLKSDSGTILTSVVNFAASWRKQDLSRDKQTCDETVPLHCEDTRDSTCRNIIEDPDFQACHSAVDPTAYFESCKQDCCGSTEEGCVCETLSAYSRACLNQGIQLNWRKPGRCERKCENGMEYKECGSSCLPDCKNANAACSDSTCIDGCFCPEDMVFHNGVCKYSFECPCLHNEREYNDSNTITQDCNSCTCGAGEWDCTENTCGSTCSAIGSAHYVTFDGLRYDFQGACSYYLMKSPNLNIVIDKRCGHIQDTCTKSVTINFGDHHVTLDHNHQVYDNGQEVTSLPYIGSGFIVSMVSSLFMEMKLSNEIIILWDGQNRIHIKAPPSFQKTTSGLCGTYDGKQNNDFLTSSGVSENNVNLFGNQWKTESSCTDVPSTSRNKPCENEVRRYEAEERCKVLKNEVFEECHDLVAVEEYYKNCMYDMCSCTGNLRECFCPSLGYYADKCATQAVFIPWRDEVKECKVQCLPGQVYQVCGRPCERTCRNMAENTDPLCDQRCVEGCNCPNGEALNDKQECVSVDDCPCIFDGREYPAGFTTMMDLKTCTCTKAQWKCERINFNVPMKSVQPLCPKLMEYSSCKSPCQATCDSSGNKESCDDTNCKPGCVCVNGYVLDGDRCVSKSQCPCHHGDKSYYEGDSFFMDCNKCTCQDQGWQCEDKDCPATCSAYGDSHFSTFDGRKYEFQGECDYILAQSSNFTVTMQNIVCGTSGVTCSKSIDFIVGEEGTETFHRLKLVRGKRVVADPRSPFKVEEIGEMVYISVSSGISLQWDKGTRIYLKLGTAFMNKVKGLCGNFNGNRNDDFTLPHGGPPVAKPTVFGDGWKVHSYCADSKTIVDTCKISPERRAWAQLKCSVLASEVFAPCHVVMPFEDYRERCEYDACACDQGGDCECLCTAIAAYAHECATRGIIIKWRSKDLCSLECSDCKSYNPCMSRCPKKTCDNRLLYHKMTETCKDEHGVCFEGCDLHPCPKGQVYDSLVEPVMCIPEPLCDSPSCDINGKKYKEGERIDDPSVCRLECEICNCRNGKLDHITYGKCSHITHTTMTSTPAVVTVATPKPPVPCIKSGWTSWMSASAPTYGNIGDRETQVELRKMYSFCANKFITNIHCHAIGQPNQDLLLTQNVTCSLDKGFSCQHKDQTDGLCLDYEVSFYCNCDINTVSTGYTTATFGSTTEPSSVSTPNWQVHTRLKTSSTPQTSTEEVTSTPKPVTPSCGWTQWLNSFTPDVFGEKETLSNLRMHFSFCEHPVKILCRTVPDTSHPDGIAFDHAGQHAVSCDLNRGLVCTNRMQQKGQSCFDYEVSLFCVDACTSVTEIGTTPTPTVGTVTTPFTSINVNKGSTTGPVDVTISTPSVTSTKTDSTHATSEKTEATGSTSQKTGTILLGTSTTTPGTGTTTSGTGTTKSETGTTTSGTTTTTSGTETGTNTQKTDTTTQEKTPRMITDTPGTGSVWTGTPGTVSVSTGTPGTGSVSTGTPGTGSVSTGTPGTGSVWTGTPGTGSVWTGTPGTGSVWTGTPGTGSVWTGTPGTGSVSTGTPGTGSVWTETPGTGSVSTGSPGTGSVWTGTPGTGSVSTRTPGTGSVWTGTPGTGSVSTGTPGTGSVWTGTPGTGSVWTGTPGTGSVSTGTPGTGSVSTGTPGTGSVLTGTPGTGSVWTGTPGTGSVWTGTPGTGSVSTGTPGTGSVWTGTPGTGSVWTGTPGTGSVSTGSPGTDSVWTGTPGTGSVSTGTPGTGSVSTGTPGTGSVWTGTPRTGSVSTGTPGTGSVWTGTPGTGSVWTGTPGTGSVWTGTPGTGSVSTGSPGTDSVWTGTPGTGSVSTGTPGPGSVSTGTPGTGSVWTGTPGTGSVSTGTPGTGSVWTGTPGTGSVWTGTPGTGSVWTGTPGTGSVSTGSPGTDSVWTGTPGTGSVSTGTPGTGSVSTGTPGTGSVWTGTPGTGSVSTGTPGTGSVWTGTPGTGSVWTGTPGTGSVWTGTPGTGSVSTGLPGTDSVWTATPGTGSVSTGTPGTGSVSTGTPGTGSVWTGTPGTGSVSTGTPGTGSVWTGTPGTGSVWTGTPGTDSFSTGTPGTGSVWTGTPGTGSVSTGTPGTVLTLTSTPETSSITTTTLGTGTNTERTDTTTQEKTPKMVTDTPGTVSVSTGTPGTVSVSTGTPGTISITTTTPGTGTNTERTDTTTQSVTPGTVAVSTGTPGTVSVSTGTPGTVSTTTTTLRTGTNTERTDTTTQEKTPRMVTDTLGTVSVSTGTPGTVSVSTGTPRTASTTTTLGTGTNTERTDTTTQEKTPRIVTDTPGTVSVSTGTPGTVSVSTGTPGTASTTTTTPGTSPTTTTTPGTGTKTQRTDTTTQEKTPRMVTDTPGTVSVSTGTPGTVSATTGETPVTVTFPAGTVCNISLNVESPEIFPSKRLTASSSSNIRVTPWKGRLSNQRSAWVPSKNSKSEWLQVDFEKVEVIAGLKTQGHPKEDKWISSYTISYSTDGYKFNLIRNKAGKPLIFTGNSDRNNIKDNTFPEMIPAHYIRIIPLTWSPHGIALRISYYGCSPSPTVAPPKKFHEPDCKKHMGLSNPSVISDGQLTASSEKDEKSAAKFSRITSSKGSWVPSLTDKNPWIQVDFLEPKLITGILIQGHGVENKWVESFQVLHSMNGIVFEPIKEQFKPRTFIGNDDKSTSLTNYFRQNVDARYIRILPIDFHGGVAMRFEVIGCNPSPQKNNITEPPVSTPKSLVCKTTMGLQKNYVTSSDQLTASSYLDEDHTPQKSSLIDSKESWIPSTGSNHHWIQMNFDEPKLLSGIATKGSPDSQRWISKYNIYYNDLAMKKFVPYTKNPEDTEPMEMTGNSDQNTLKRTLFNREILTNKIRLVVLKNGPIGVGLRFDFLSCHPNPPTAAPTTPSTTTSLSHSTSTMGIKIVTFPTPCTESGWLPFVTRTFPDVTDGDREYLTESELRKACSGGTITKIECYTIDNTLYLESGDVVECNLKNGLTCNNAVNEDVCQDYKIRYWCQCQPGSTPKPTSTPSQSPSTSQDTNKTHTTTSIKGQMMKTPPIPTRQTPPLKNSSVTPSVSPPTTQRIKVRCAWSPWLNVDKPDTDPTDEGDIETISALRRTFGICPRIDNIECRVAGSATNAFAANQTGIHCDPINGLRCFNKQTQHGICYDYEVRIHCWSHSCEESTTTSFMTPTKSTASSTGPRKNSTDIGETNTSTVIRIATATSAMTTTTPCQPGQKWTACSYKCHEVCANVAQARGSCHDDSCVAGCMPNPKIKCAQGERLNEEGNCVAAQLCFCMKPDGTEARPLETWPDPKEPCSMCSCFNNEVVCGTNSAGCTPTTTPESTTLTKSTTPSKPTTTSENATPSYDCGWSRWINIPPVPGRGDFQILSKLDGICAQPTYVECRDSVTHKDARSLGQTIACNHREGSKCFNYFQSGRTCADYEIKVFCPCTVSPTFSTTRGIAEDTISTTEVTSTPTSPIRTRKPEVCGWTSWFSGHKPNALGEIEYFKLLRTHHEFCDTGSILGIECRDKVTKQAAEDIGQNIVCDIHYGLICFNNAQSDSKCADYEIRVFCDPKGSDCTHVYVTTPNVQTNSTFTTPQSTVTGTRASICNDEMGLRSGAIHDDMISASSQRDHSHSPKSVRLDSRSSWMPAINNKKQYLQVDFGKDDTIITGIKVQGSPNTDTSVTTYRIEFSSDGIYFNPYRETQDKDKIFHVEWKTGAGVSTEYFKSPIRTRIIRIIPVTWNGHISMRMELIGCPPQYPTPTMKVTTQRTTATPTTGTKIIVTATTPPNDCVDWKDWVDFHQPSLTDKDDIEPIDELRDATPNCTTPIAIQCRTATPDHFPYDESGQPATCNIWQGFVCHASDLANGNLCFNYEARLGCLRDVPECTQVTTGIPPPQLCYPDLDSSHCPREGCARGLFCDGKKCVNKSECPCALEDKIIRPGGSSKNEKCQLCQCLNGEVICMPLACPRSSCPQGRPFLNADTCECECQNCTHNEFQCSNGVCILRSQRCDKIIDCVDDEINCGTETTSQSHPTTPVTSHVITSSKTGISSTSPGKTSPTIPVDENTPKTVPSNTPSILSTSPGRTPPMISTVTYSQPSSTTQNICARVTCPPLRIPQLKSGLSIKLTKTEDGCCYKYIVCDPYKCKQPKVECTAPFVKETLAGNTCCSKQKCVCPSECLKQERPVCATGFDLIEIPQDCNCTTYTCMPVPTMPTPPKECKYTRNYKLVDGKSVKVTTPFVEKYKPGESWKDGPCKACSCDNSTGVFLEAACEKELCVPCSFGFTSMEDGSCCGKCEESGCIIGNKVYQVGEEFPSDRPCFVRSCEKDNFNDGFLIRDSQINCTAFDQLPRCKDDIKESEMYDKSGCCRKCQPKEVVNKICSTCSPMLIFGHPKNSIGYFNITLESGVTCQNEVPMPKLKKCTGYCPSSSVFTHTMQSPSSQCKSCQVATSNEVKVILSCSNGQTITKNYDIPKTCSCSSC